MKSNDLKKVATFELEVISILLFMLCPYFPHGYLTKIISCYY